MILVGIFTQFWRNLDPLSPNHYTLQQNQYITVKLDGILETYLSFSESLSLIKY
ncbi:hypothetical protein M595_4292 [Lyngbya aestuarii BL J]|uniref:Uncharacterized protein n=1 Tax=Lyngbya aestuarii BL J TaxID=1348334 RepID=U7QD26_9CYAN|nr:hypothetical protein M595_4292 [Lyngbya aestuarii BL J]